MHHEDADQAHLNQRHRHEERALLFVLLVAQLMVILDITAVNIALPSLAS